MSLLAATAAGRGRDGYATMRTVDTRVAAIGYRLIVANAALCPHRVPATGLVLQSLDQYPVGERIAVREAFGFPAPVAVEAVVPASPANRAGVTAGEGVRSIDGRTLAATPAPRPTSASRDAALAAIATAPAGAPLAITLVRDGAERRVVLRPVLGCAIDIDVRTDAGMVAQAGSRSVQVGAGLAIHLDDAALAIVLAHELAHVILGHASSPSDRDAGSVRAMEDAADRLSVALLYNAGDDPASPSRFWLTHGREIERGRPRLHRAPRERAALLAGAAAAIPVGTPRPYLPPVPGDGDDPAA